MVLKLILYFVIFTFTYIPRPGHPVGQSGFNVSQTEEIGFLFFWVKTFVAI